jgi:hypothetical protein
VNSSRNKGYYMLREPWARNVEESDSLWLAPPYLRACKELNLPLTEEQKEILNKWEEEQKKY